jgi:Divergent InlB B-repeat domain
VVLAIAFLLALPAGASAGSRGQVHLQTTPAASGVWGAPVGGVSEHPRSLAPNLQPSSGPVYDEQLGLTFTQSFTSLQYNVTAIEQTDAALGTGPAYLLNGLTDRGYWYQLGVSWDWSPGQVPGTGFDMIFEVWNSSAASVYPAAEGAGLDSFSGPVNQGDSIVLNLTLSSGVVTMRATDANTKAAAEETYSSEGASSFVGLPGATSDARGFFTGLMTEWYHGDPYYGAEQQVTYNSSEGISSAWMWADEFSCPDSNCTSTSLLFQSNSEGPVYYADPTKLITFTSNGATEYSDAYTFITGTPTTPPSKLVSLTFDYTVLGGGAYSPPVLSYYDNGTLLTAQLIGTQTVQIDKNSIWNISSVLGGSDSMERWATNQLAIGVAVAPQSLSYVYYRQFLVDPAVEVLGGGSGYSFPTASYLSFGSADITPLGQGVWADAGSSVIFPELLQGSGGSERWIAQTTTVAALAPGTVSLTYRHQFYASVGGPTGEGNTSAFAGWLYSGAVVDLNATAAQGWRFEGWSGTGAGGYSTNSSSASFSLLGPANETAVFYPSLTLGASGRGSVEYAYGSTGGTVSSGSETVYVPTGTSVSLSAHPTSFLDSFYRWDGALKGSNPSEHIQISAPSEISASFGFNLTAIGAIVALAAIVVALIGLVMSRRRPDPPAGLVE